MMKGDLSNSEFLLRIKTIMQSLQLISDLVFRWNM